MKPLLLQMQAFGPFARRQEIDFSLLGTKTFFLIHGPTGSGKTSILDGMCFALFGDSSGGEREGRQMRSHHADPGVLTEVNFEFALGAVRYRVQRVPEQQRKALRGGGLVKQNQQAELWRVEGEGEARTEAPLATGWSKVTERVAQLLGFESRQFRQVIMLPQGRFFEFLKSSSQDRERILQVLFGTELYKRIEESLKRAADEVAARGKEVRTRRQALLDQAGVPGEEELAAVQASQRAVLEAGRLEEQRAAAAAEAAEAVLAAARQLGLQFEETDAARKRLAELEGEQAHWQQQALRRDAARKAAVLRPYEAHWQQSQQALAREQARLAERAAALVAAQEAEAQAGAELARQQQRAPEQQQWLARVSELQALRPRVESLDRCRAEHGAAQRRHQDAVAQEASARSTRQRCLQALERLQQEIQALATPAAALAAERLRLQQLQEQERQARELARATQQLAAAEETERARQAELATAQARCDAAAAQRQEVFRQWMAGQAARIAHALVEGEACPVCGAHEHPAPALAEARLVGDEALAAADEGQRQADTMHRGALAALASAQQQVAALRGKAEALRGPSEMPSANLLQAQVRQATEAVQHAGKAADELAQRQQRLAVAQREAGDSETRLQAAQQTTQQANGELQRLAGQLEQLQQAIAPELASLPALDAALADATRQRDALARALQQAEAAAGQAAQALARARALAEESTAACQRCAEACEAHAEALEQQRRVAGFADLASYRSAKLEDAELDTLEAAIRRFEQDLAAARERLQRAETQTHERERPDLATRSAEHQAAQAARLAASNAVRDALAALANTEGYVASLAQIAQEFRQLEERFQVLKSVSDLATGNNAHRMSFQRYVLATLLEEVLAATTLRLRVMSRGRYEMRRKLEASDARAAGGLDLEVFDHYTGTTRAVATLSGGESFLASLALALGLSDVVQSHAGGLRLDAIFVDEGFGTLDPEALDFAIRTLKDLQQAGRMVGIISHVAELKEWIAARLELRSTQAGSEAAFVL